jgi:hypothetical protein
VVHLSPITLTMRSEFGQIFPGGSDDSISIPDGESASAVWSGPTEIVLLRGASHVGERRGIQ